MNRATSYYRLTVAVAGDFDEREAALQHLIGGLPALLQIAGTGHDEGHVEVAFRASDDLQAISIAQGALAEGYAHAAAEISTGFGVHRRRVAEQVAR